MILEAATVENLEFDGNTVLCRVCGDKASGFHYGVHACEGCKGFFRRSIQQKIQYRPCLKNQQCNIMRVNRNRCQYCRLKKCISVGMSRDAVRFGRVPKKEKAKIMEQMKRVNALTQMNALDSTLESDPDFLTKVVTSHFKNCDFTKEKLRSLCQKAWSDPKYITCPAHMACPLNPKPDNTENSDQWQEFTEFFTPAIRNVVNFAKNLPGFQLFSQEDQVTLLKAGTFEVLLVHLAPLFDSKNNTMMFANGKLYKKDSQAVGSNAGFLLDSMFDFAERINTMSLNDEEIALFSASVIVASDRPGLRNVEIVEKVQSKLHRGLQTMLNINHPDDHALFDKIIRKIPDLRTLNTLHSEKLLGATASQNTTALIKHEHDDDMPAQKQECADDSKLRHQSRDTKPTACPFTSAPTLPGLASYNPMLQFAPQLPAAFTAGLPDFRQSMLQAAYMYGRLPPPPLNTCWPGLNLKTEANDIPIWAQIASANQSIMIEQMAAKAASGGMNDVMLEDMYRGRSGSNASSVRSHSSYGGGGFDDDTLPTATACAPFRYRKKSKATHTISKSPSLDNNDLCDNNTTTTNTDDVISRKPRTTSGHMSSPEPLEMDLQQVPRVDSNRLLHRLSPPAMLRGYLPIDDAATKRKRCLPGDKTDTEPKIPRIQALWDYEMRASRSNSISSSSSMESADSAYRTISNPGTPRSSIIEARSPYPQVTPRHSSFSETRSRSPRPEVGLKTSFSPYRNSPLSVRDVTNVSPSPLVAAIDDNKSSRSHVGQRHHDMTTTSATNSAAADQETNRSNTSPVLKTALSLPPLLGQEAWFHTPKRNNLMNSSFIAPSATSTVTTTSTSSAVAATERRHELPRTVSQDTTASEDIDVESVETDNSHHVTSSSSSTSQVESTNSNVQKVFKLKRSLLERFSPEPQQPISSKHQTAVDRIKRNTTSPTGSLPERLSYYDHELPARSKSTSPNPRAVPIEIKPEPELLRETKNDESSFSSAPLSSVDFKMAAATATSRASVMTPTMHHQLMASQLSNAGLLSLPGAATAYPTTALMYQYAAMQQQIQSMQAMQHNLNRNADLAANALNMAIKEESQH